MQISLGSVIRLIIRLSFLVVAFFTAMSAWNSYVDTSTLVKNSLHAQGVVVDMKTYLQGTSDENYGPVVHFTTAAGQTQEFESGDTSTPPMYQSGDKVDVFYDPANPPQARIYNPWIVYLGTGIQIFETLIFLIIGIIIFIQAGPTKQEKAISKQIKSHNSLLP